MEDYFCYRCGQYGDDGNMLICERCEARACHWYCDGLPELPDRDWYCGWCRDILM